MTKYVNDLLRGGESDVECRINRGEIDNMNYGLNMFLLIV